MKPSSTSAPKPTFTHELADEKSIPLGVGDMSAEDQALDPLAGAHESKRFRTGSILIVVVVAIACAGLWFMRSLSHVSAATGGKNEVEETIEKFLGQRDSKGNLKGSKGNQAAVLEVLRDDYLSRQVPLEAVQCNPFILPGEGEAAPVTPARTGEPPEVALARAREAKQKEIATATARLQLKSVIMASQPLANISGTIVREGDELSPEGSEVTFTVESISADSVMLVAHDLALGLRVQTPLSMRRDR